MYQAAEEIQVEPDFAIYQNSHSGNEDSQLELLEESDGIQLCNQPWVDYDENAYDVNGEAEDRNEFISLEALKVPDESESCDDGGADTSQEPSLQSQEPEQRKRKLSNVIVLDSDDDNGIDEGDADQNEKISAKREKFTENNESDDDVILIEDDENDSGFLRNDNSFLGGNNGAISFGYYNGSNPATRIENGAYECTLCGKRVASSYNLKRHMMIHTGERPFGCDICEKRFREFSDLKKHRRIHSSDPAYKCMVCLINIPSPMNPTKCQACDQARAQGLPPSTTIKYDLGAIIQPTQSIQSMSFINSTTSIVQRTAPTSVNSTSRNFATKSTSNSNLIRNFSPASPAPMASTFTNEIVAEHFQYTEDGINKRGYSCPICDRIFGSRHNLKRHFMIHTGEKPFSCDVCERSFREFSTLKKHTLTHMRGKFYNCEICGEEFTNYGSYTAHTLKHSNNYNYNDGDPLGNTSGLILPNAIVETNVLYKSNMFQCFTCGKNFKEQEKLNAHLVVHKENGNKFSGDLTKIDDDVPIIINNPIDC